ncbi:hypothetical protein KKC67_01275 [Patescibacteria group bacterium]|nr:hypothetical protein [Patescibacteria group bacterium]MBU0879570.1 hypothetical protein [Patescibacteria group bacterium]MBU0880406.1 hypothetical protein [Patescibacteria group bacterium]MBU1783029.1 hypothetical protein [Patescibacteria group bacterium]MBU1991629.1 hypothetical protein [Patescibacteria group bacterium]
MKSNQPQKNTNNISPAVLILVKLRFLFQKGNNFVKSCVGIEDLDTKVVLSTLAIELLVKASIGTEICMQNTDKTEIYIKKEIDKKFRSIGHDFKKLFNNALGLKKELNIESINKENGMGIIDDYRIKLYNNGFPLIFKTLEASRYGSFSFNEDVMILANRTKEDEFLQTLSGIVSKEIRLAFIKLKPLQNEN